VQVTREPNTPPLTVFLFDDEESSWPQFWRMVVQNKTCDELRCEHACRDVCAPSCAAPPPLLHVPPSDNKSSAHAKAAIFEDPSAAPTPYGAKIHSFKNIRGRLLVRVACGAWGERALCVFGSERGRERSAREDKPW
jgi:hypothetical protein